ncbi:MAG: hypothetical protein ABIR79_01275, partial [Candidatus Binatia bacterium]
MQRELAAIEQGLAAIEGHDASGLPPAPDALAALAAEHGLRSGTVSVHPDGFAFLIEPGRTSVRG